jgi:hypothetical protein
VFTRPLPLPFAAAADAASCLLALFSAAALKDFFWRAYDSTEKLARALAFFRLFLLFVELVKANRCDQRVNDNGWWLTDLALNEYDADADDDDEAMGWLFFLNIKLPVSFSADNVGGCWSVPLAIVELNDVLGLRTGGTALEEKEVFHYY